VSAIVARERARKLQPFVRAEDAVFEYGVGTGLNLRFMTCRRRIGYDVSHAGRAACEAAGIEFVEDLSEVPRGMSVAICHHVLEHVPDPLECLGQLRDILAVGGRLIMCVPFETFASYRRYVPGDPNHHLYSWNALTLGNLATAAGFSVTDARVRPFGYEQRLAPLAQYAGMWAYRGGLAIVRTLHPADEVFLQAVRP
jgi:SAM-dependent methyltransferase